MAANIEGDYTSKEGRPGPLGVKNYLNVGAFALNALTTTLSGRGVFGATNGELAAKYAILNGPAGFAFAIWGPIFLWEAFFALMQLLPMFRSNKLIDLVTPGFVGACIAQSCWSVLFGSEMIVPAFIAMLTILAGLMSIAINTDGVAMSWEEYFCLRGMFSLHGGWILAATTLNGCIVADRARAAPEVMLGIAITSVGALCVVASIFALTKRSPDPIVPGVAAWAFNAISSKLGSGSPDYNNPDKWNPHVWSKETLGGLQVATMLVTYVALLLAAAAVFRSIRMQCGSDSVRLQKEAGVGSQPLTGPETRSSIMPEVPSVEI